ncbi:MAG: Ig-like domain-containing protein, partial [Bauldia sp.]
MKSILSLVPLLAILATACSDDPAGPDNPIDPVASVAIAPGVRELTVGGTLGLAATVKSVAGKTLNRTIAWTTANPSIAT